jgi:hypothetical protein
MTLDDPMPHTVDVLLEQQGLSIPQLADGAGIETGRMEAIVTGRWTPSPAERARIAAALGLTTDDISWGHTMSPRNVRYHRFGLPEHLSDRQDGTPMDRRTPDE